MQEQRNTVYSLQNQVSNIQFRMYVWSKIRVFGSLVFRNAVFSFLKQVRSLWKQKRFARAEKEF